MRQTEVCTRRRFADQRAAIAEWDNIGRFNRLPSNILSPIGGQRRAPFAAISCAAPATSDPRSARTTRWLDDSKRRRNTAQCGACE